MENLKENQKRPKKLLKRKSESEGLKNIKRFRSIKPEIRILGVDDAPFVPHSGEQVMLIGTLFRAGNWLDGVLRTYITVDGTDATESLIALVNDSRHWEQLGVMMLDGITFGGFNVVNIQEIFQNTGVPVIVIMRKYPDLPRIKKALMNFPDWEERWIIFSRQERYLKSQSMVRSPSTCRSVASESKMPGRLWNCLQPGVLYPNQSAWPISSLQG